MFTLIKNTLFSVSLFNISFNKKKESTQIKEEALVPILEEKVPFKDLKTLYGICGLELIDKMCNDLTAYLFIQKNKDHSSWNLVVPVIIDRITNEALQFGQGYFALEGSGGGLNYTDSIFRKLKEHKANGFNVSICPIIVDNKLLDDFEYIDSNLKWNDLLKDGINLANYRKREFVWIYKQYSEIKAKYQL